MDNLSSSVSQNFYHQCGICFYLLIWFILSFAEPAFAETGGIYNKSDLLHPTLVNFSALSCETQNCVQLNWEIISDSETVGFHIWRNSARNEEYRRLPGLYVTVNDALIENGRAFYECFDDTIDLYPTTYKYILEEEDIFPSIENNRFGPVRADMTGSKPIESENDGATCFISTFY